MVLGWYGDRSAVKFMASLPFLGTLLQRRDAALKVF
jgi:hypothetical protein